MASVLSLLMQRSKEQFKFSKTPKQFGVFLFSGAIIAWPDDSMERITGVSRISINRYENGKIMPSVQAVNQLLVTMGYRLDIVPICDSEYEEMEEMQNEKKTDL